MYADSNTAVAEEFDINAPELASYVPEGVDPGAIQEKTYPPPPDDGNHLLALRLDDKNAKGPVYLKGTKDPSTGAIKDARLVAAIQAKFVNEDGTEGSYLKRWYPTSDVLKGQKASAISSLCYLSGRPFTKGAVSLGDQKALVERIFAEATDGVVHVKARTRWIKSVPKVDPETGLYVYKPGVFDAKGNPVKDYQPDIKGQAKIKKLATIEAMNYVATWQIEEFEKGTTPEEFQKLKDDYVASAADNAHFFLDPVSGETLQVQVEIDQLVEE